MISGLVVGTGKPHIMEGSRSELLLVVCGCVSVWGSFSCLKIILLVE